jgi:hypothetical protein
MCFAIQIAKQRSRLHAHHSQLRVNGNPVHRREVDDNAIIAEHPAGDIVAATFDRQEDCSRAQTSRRERRRPLPNIGRSSLDVYRCSHSKYAAELNRSRYR